MPLDDLAVSQTGIMAELSNVVIENVTIEYCFFGISVLGARLEKGLFKV